MLTENELLVYRRSLQESTSAYKAFSKSTAEASVFLSHSHKDRELVEGFINYLAHWGKIRVYVDWQDSDLPAATNHETARKIKKKIGDLDYFLVLATENALKSKWVPWEIGIADAIKPDKIAIVPVADSSGRFNGNEYLQLYPRLDLGTLPSGGNLLAVFRPNQNYGGVPVRSWLTNPLWQGH
jgi:hypothetical protein